MRSSKRQCKFPIRISIADYGCSNLTLNRYTLLEFFITKTVSSVNKKVYSDGRKVNRLGTAPNRSV